VAGAQVSAEDSGRRCRTNVITLAHGQVVKKFIWDNQDVLLETDAGGNTQDAYTVSPAL